MRFYYFLSIPVVPISIFQLLIVLLCEFETNNSLNSSVFLDTKGEFGDELMRLKCYVSVTDQDESLWNLAKCAPTKQWCIKVISEDDDFQIRDCDPGYCDAFGERCGPGEEANSSSILPKSTLCCCHGPAGCNGTARLLINTHLAALIFLLNTLLFLSYRLSST